MTKITPDSTQVKMASTVATRVETPPVVDPVVDRADDKLSLPKVLPCMYVVQRGWNNAPLERLTAADEGEAVARLKREVTAGSGQVPIVFLYKLVAAEEYQPTSVTRSLDDLIERNAASAQRLQNPDEGK